MELTERYHSSLSGRASATISTIPNPQYPGIASEKRGLNRWFDENTELKRISPFPEKEQIFYRSDPCLIGAVLRVAGVKPRSHFKHSIE